MNWKSPVKLRKVLFGELGLPVIRRTKTGASTAEDVLQALKDQHPLIPLLIRHRELSKLYTTYTDNWINKISDVDNRLHADINMTGTPTGRISMSNPNPQQIPKQGEYAKSIRRSFVAEEVSVLVESDFSNMDLRVLAHHSGDKELCNAFKNNEDIHNHTAQLIGSDRQTAKTLNFALMYGQQAKSLSKQLGISEDEAKKFIRKYYYKYWGVRQWQKKVKFECEKNGYVETFLGFIRYISDINSLNPYKKAAAERMAWSSICSGGTANSLEVAMIKLRKKLPDLKMLLPIHDALVFEVPEGSDISEIKKTMESAVSLNVPIKCSVKVGRTLGDLKEI